MPEVGVDSGARRARSEPQTLIVDAQIHLWEADRPTRPWPPGIKADLDTPMTAERFIPIMDQAGVSRAIIAPPGVCGFDPSYALECAARFPKRFAVTSRWTLDHEDARSRLPTWLDQPGMVGIRLALTPANRERWGQSRQLAQFWEDAERYRIPLMIFAPDGQLTEVAGAAARHRSLKLVVDHLNLVGAEPEDRAARLDELLALARYENVAVKLGALPIRSDAAYPFADLHELIQRAYHAFGARRLMWASDHTTSAARNKASYLENLNLVRVAALGRASAEDMRWVLGLTLSDWFGWP